MERRALVAIALAPSSKRNEVLGRVGNGLAVESNDNSTQVLVAVRDVKVYLAIQDKHWRMNAG